jgi:hypothetical protein
MASEDELKNKIQTYDWDKLTVLWQQIQDDDTPEWKSGKALEYFILRAFELEGAEVRYPFSVPTSTLASYNKGNDLEQIDGVVYVNGLACLVECKDYQKAINFEPIAKLRSQLMRRPSTTIASIFSIEGFTESASILLDFIYPQTILAWEKNQIDCCLREKFFCKALTKKYQRAIEFGTYNFFAVDEENLL